MTDNDPVDALKTERADSTYDFPTSASMASGEHNQASAKNDERNFREASKSWDAGGDGSSSSNLRASAKEVQDAISQRHRIASDTTDDFVHENPWKAITMAALAGVVVGMLVSR
ncbi:MULTISPECIES: YqjD family protein [unclassified Caballeronia]|uniref:DUF883 family protein n=1 Tax=unclassified Caballeronia TaxID=2646786 RepID=UPI001F27F3A0|nr:MULTISPECIES: DUF883 domain-containing protein [unclassified Caballeronia]MCE4547416.1 DUF883 domain-containing protein [Caballeronia sp. PC1]MCE4575401.1 DUF883 domain-containing protein [Caballeronia sp. CLC5]